MPNPNPNQTDEFKKHRFKPKAPVYSDSPLANKPTQVRLGQDITAAIDSLGDAKPGWLRRVITEAASRELGASPAVNPGAEPLAGAGSGDTSRAGELLGTAPPPDKPLVESPAMPLGEAPLVIAPAELLAVVDQLLAVPRLPKPAREKLQNLRDRLKGVTA